MLKVKCIPVGLIGTNCYVVYREDSREAVILDPGAEEERIVSFLTEESLKPRAILLTHGHYDHILAVPALLRKYGIPLYAAEEERKLLSNGKYNMSGTEPEDAVEIRDFLPLKDGDTLSLLGEEWKVLATPGHTRGSLSFFIDGNPPYLFSGDTLFHESYGRTDLYSGSETAIIDSIRKKLFVLPGDTVVFPGHEEGSTIQNEKEYNPINFFRD